MKELLADARSVPDQVGDDVVGHDGKRVCNWNALQGRLFENALAKMAFFAKNRLAFAVRMT